MKKEISPKLAALLIVGAVLAIVALGWYQLTRSMSPPPYMPRPGDIPGMPPGTDGKIVNAVPSNPALPPGLPPLPSKTTRQEHTAP